LPGQRDARTQATEQGAAEAIFQLADLPAEGRLQARKDMTSERYRRGWDKLKEIDGEQGERVVASLHDIAPDFADYLIEFLERPSGLEPSAEFASPELLVFEYLLLRSEAG